MARVLIVGCGCRGRALGQRLEAEGHRVRGTSRSEEGRAAIESAGLEGVVADPDRIGTVLAQLQGVSVVTWLMGSASGEAEAVAALHGPRLETLLERLVDTQVHGFVYEGAGTVDQGCLFAGRDHVSSAAARWRIPVAVIEEGPRGHRRWVAAGQAAVAQVLAAGS